jgi:hypothetical protein
MSVLQNVRRVLMVMSVHLDISPKFPKFQFVNLLTGME